MPKKLTPKQIENLANTLFLDDMRTMFTIVDSVYRFSNAHWLYADSEEAPFDFTPYGFENSPYAQRERIIFAQLFQQLTLDVMDAMQFYLKDKSSEELTGIFSPTKECFNTEEDFCNFINSLINFGSQNTIGKSEHCKFIVTMGLLTSFNGKDFSEVLDILYPICEE